MTRHANVPKGFAYEPVLEIPMIRAFLNSFKNEQNRFNELIEATLCYGIHCLSNNYSLHSIQVSDVSTIAGVKI